MISTAGQLDAGSSMLYVSMNNLLFLISLLNYYDPLLLNNRVDEMKKKNEHISQLEDQLKKREEEVEDLRKKIEIERFGVQRFSNDNSMILLYTGFVSLAIFTAVFDYIKPVANSMNSYHYKSNEK